MEALPPDPLKNVVVSSIDTDGWNEDFRIYALLFFAPINRKGKNILFVYMNQKIAFLVCL